MNVTIDLRYGPNSQPPTKEGMQRTIDALDRAIAKANGEDGMLLTDAKSIFRAMQRQLPDPRPTATASHQAPVRAIYVHHLERQADVLRLIFPDIEGKRTSTLVTLDTAADLGKAIKSPE